MYSLKIQFKFPVRQNSGQNWLLYFYIFKNYCQFFVSRGIKHITENLYGGSERTEDYDGLYFSYKRVLRPIKKKTHFTINKAY